MIISVIEKMIGVSIDILKVISYLILDYICVTVILNVVEINTLNILIKRICLIVFFFFVDYILSVVFKQPMVLTWIKPVFEYYLVSAENYPQYFFKMIGVSIDIFKVISYLILDYICVTVILNVVEINILNLLIKRICLIVFFFFVDYILSVVFKQPMVLTLIKPALEYYLANAENYPQYVFKIILELGKFVVRISLDLFLFVGFLMAYMADVVVYVFK